MKWCEYASLNELALSNCYLFTGTGIRCQCLAQSLTTLLQLKDSRPTNVRICCPSTTAHQQRRISLSGSPPPHESEPVLLVFSTVALASSQAYEIRAAFVPLRFANLSLPTLDYAVVSPSNIYVHGRPRDSIDDCATVPLQLQTNDCN
ncbi:hypothetical protein ECG_02978 [Echinococcus granulosus]|nr:hypothetical protein ECG_02978 [Echinococcus granulosus]